MTHISNGSYSNFTFTNNVLWNKKYIPNPYLNRLADFVLRGTLVMVKKVVRTCVE